MPTLQEIEEQRRAQVYLEKARTRARSLLTCIAFRQDPANPTCRVAECPHWRVDACRKLQELIGECIGRWEKDIRLKAEDKERERRQQEAQQNGGEKHADVPTRRRFDPWSGRRG